MMLYLFGGPTFTVKDPEKEPEHIKGRHARRHGGKQPEQRMPLRRAEGLPQDFVFTEESGKTGDAGNGEAGDKKGPVCDGGFLPQASHVPYVQFPAHGVHDAPRPQEQEPLEKGVGHEMKNARPIGADTYSQEHETQLAYGGVGEDFLNVVLGKTYRGGKKCRQHADNSNNHHGVRRHIVQKIKPGYHIYPCGDHRCRVNERAYRRRAFHGIGQPHVKGYLRRFSHGPHKEEKGD